MQDRLSSFERAIAKHHEQLKTHLKSLFHHLVQQDCTEEDRKMRINATCGAISRHCQALELILNPKDFPAWLQPIDNSSKIYQEKPTFKVFEPMHLLFSDVQNHKWTFQENAGINFDAIYKEYKNKSELPGLIDELVSLLQKIIDENGEELQTKTLKDLTKLLDTVLANKNGSASAVESCFWLVLDFIKRSLFAIFPAIQISADGFETVKQIIGVCQKGTSVNQSVMAEVAEKTNGLFDYGAKYNQLGQIDYKSVIPEKVIEHYIKDTV